MQAYRVKCLEENLQGDSSTSVVDRDREAMFRMNEQHPNKGSMNDDQERMESVAPVAERTGASGRGQLARVVEECCRLPSVLMSRKEAERDACSRWRRRLPMLSWTVYRCLMVRSPGYRHFQGDLKDLLRRPSLKVARVEWKDARGRKSCTLCVVPRSTAWGACESKPA